MQVSEALQVALFAACAALVLLVACVVPILFQAHRRLEQLALAAGRSRAKLDLLADDSHELVRNLSRLADRATLQLDEIDSVVQTAKRWMGRADLLENAVGSTVEPPVFSAVRSMSLVRAGMNGFLRVLLHRKNSP